MKRKTRFPKERAAKQLVNPVSTIAERLIPLAGALFVAFRRACGQVPGEAELSPCGGLTVWCYGIADQLMKTVFKSVVAFDPKGKFDARNYGRMVGVLLRGGVFLGREAEAILRKEGLSELSEGEGSKIKEMSGLELLFPIASARLHAPIRNENQLFHRAERHAQRRVAGRVEGGGLVPRKR